MRKQILFIVLLFLAGVHSNNIYGRTLTELPSKNLIAGAVSGASWLTLKYISDRTKRALSRAERDRNETEQASPERVAIDAIIDSCETKIDRLEIGKIVAFLALVFSLEDAFGCISP